MRVAGPPHPGGRNPGGAASGGAAIRRPVAADGALSVPPSRSWRWDSLPGRGEGRLLCLISSQPRHHPQATAYLLAYPPLD